MKFRSRSPEETFQFASEFAKGLQGGEVLALVGNLGAGKTTFVQGLASGLHIPQNAYVRSPTFTLINEYPGSRLPLFHLDFYRLKSASDAETLGLEEYFCKEGICVVEWADLFPGLLPSHSIKIEFQIVDEERREITVRTKDCN